MRDNPMTPMRSTYKKICAQMVRLTVLLALAGCGGSNNNDDPANGGSSCGSGPTGTGATVAITGHLQYEDKTYNQNGFTGATAMKPIRFAAVQVVRSCDEAVLNSASDASDANGDYTVTFTNTDTAGVYIRVLASAPPWQIRIMQPPNLLWALASNPIDDTGAAPFTMDLTAGLDSGGGVFNLLDVMTSGAEFVNALSGALPPLTVNWSPGSCDGTYFSPADNGIFVLGGCTDGDTDEYDDPVLLHEFGHFANSVYSRDDSPGGIHFLNSNDQDIRLSWSEGWGNFFSSAVRNDPLYVDTVGSAAIISVNLEDLSNGMGIDLAADAIYSTNEISVAVVLWDIFDNTPTEPLATAAATDALAAGMTPIWDVISHYVFTCTGCNVSIEDFWDGWFNCPTCTTVNHESPTEMAALIADRKISFKLDSREPDNDAASAPDCPLLPCTSSHTLYTAGDLDYVKFTATAGASYTIQTSRLSNGADTFLEVLDTNGTTVLMSNDDATAVTKNSTCGVNFVTQQSNCPPNDATTLSSKVVFTPTAGGTYYVRVKHAPAAPPSAGLYGSYDLKITSP